MCLNINFVKACGGPSSVEASSKSIKLLGSQLLVYSISSLPRVFGRLPVKFCELVHECRALASSMESVVPQGELGNTVSETESLRDSEERSVWLLMPADAEAGLLHFTREDSQRFYLSSVCILTGIRIGFQSLLNIVSNSTNIELQSLTALAISNALYSCGVLPSAGLSDPILFKSILFCSRNYSRTLSAPVSGGV